MKNRNGHLYKQSGSKNFYLKYTVNGKTIRKSLGTSDRDEAEKERRRIMRPLQNVDEADALRYTRALLEEKEQEVERDRQQANPPLEIENAWDAFLAAVNRPDTSPTTMERYESIWKRFTRYMGDTHPEIKAMREIDGQLASDYINHLKSIQLSASTINQHLFLMKMVWRCLSKKIRGSGDPWGEISRLKVNRLRNRRRAIEPGEFVKLLDAAPNRDLRDLLFTLGWTGQRLYDIVNLRWRDVKLEKKVIQIYPKKTERTGKLVAIPIFPQLAEMLQKRAANSKSELVFPKLAAEYDRNRSLVVNGIQKIFEDAGFTTHEKIPGTKRAITRYGAHSLRHFFATQALEAGIPAEIVKRITGHSNDAMLEHYQHFDAEKIGKLAEKIAGEQQSANALPETECRVLQPSDQTPESGAHPLPDPLPERYEKACSVLHDVIRQWVSWLKDDNLEALEADMTSALR